MKRKNKLWEVAMILCFCLLLQTKTATAATTYDLSQGGQLILNSISQSPATLTGRYPSAQDDDGRGTYAVVFITDGFNGGTVILDNLRIDLSNNTRSIACPIYVGSTAGNTSITFRLKGNNELKAKNETGRTNIPGHAAIQAYGSNVVLNFENDTEDSTGKLVAIGGAGGGNSNSGGAGIGGGGSSGNNNGGEATIRIREVIIMATGGDGCGGGAGIGGGGGGGGDGDIVIDSSIVTATGGNSNEGGGGAGIGGGGSGKGSAGYGNAGKGIIVIAESVVTSTGGGDNSGGAGIGSGGGSSSSNSGNSHVTIENSIIKANGGNSPTYGGGAGIGSGGCSSGRTSGISQIILTDSNVNGISGKGNTTQGRGGHGIAPGGGSNPGSSGSIMNRSVPVYLITVNVTLDGKASSSAAIQFSGQGVYRTTADSSGIAYCYLPAGTSYTIFATSANGIADGEKSNVRVETTSESRFNDVTISMKRIAGSTE